MTEEFKELRELEAKIKAEKETYHHGQYNIVSGDVVLWDDIEKALAQAKEEEREKILKQISKLFDAGWTIEWTIEQTSCPCGGIWAWWKPRFLGAQGYAGCVCHTNILEEALKEKK